jgi:cyclase
MLRHRIIPIVLLDGYSVLKTIQFDVRRNLGNPITIARIYNTRNVDELILLDIDAARQGRRIDMVTIEDVASECFMPLCVGGGLKTIGDIAEALSCGADKVSINSEALRSPRFVAEASQTFGSQCIVVSVDVRKGEDGGYRVHSSVNAPLSDSLLDWCRRVEDLGCGEILLNSVDRDGTMSGYDVELIKQIADVVAVPVIAAGGGRIACAFF